MNINAVLINTVMRRNSSTRYPVVRTYSTYKAFEMKITKHRVCCDETNDTLVEVKHMISLF